MADKKKVTRLLFEIIASDEWDEKGIVEMDEEFRAKFGSNLNITSACLLSYETIDDPRRNNEDAEKENDPLRGWHEV